MTEETLKEFLEGKGISQTIIKELEDEKITMSTILIMDDDQLKRFFSKLGDRIDIRDFCKRHITSKKNSLIESLREKINKRRDNGNENMSGEGKTYRKKTRTIEIGWLHFNEEEKRYKQLKTNNGGGTRKVVVDRNSNCTKVLEIGKEKFFPGGISTKGPLENFSFKLLDFKHHDIDPEVTVENMFHLTGFTKLKFYLSTKFLGDNRLSERLTSLPSSVSSSGIAIHSSAHHESNEDNFDQTDTWSNAHSVYNLDEFEEPYEDFNENFSGPLQSSTSQVLHYISETLPYASDFILQDGEFEMNSMPRLSASIPLMNMHISRKDCVAEMLQAYKDPDILQKRLNVEFLGEEGQDLGGLSKELFSIFFKDIEVMYFSGEDIVVPCIPLHRKKEKGNFVLIGKILAHMMLLTGNLPLKLSRCVYLAFGKNKISDSIILEDFLLFLSPGERKLINKALEDFKCLTLSELETITNIFASHSYMTVPRERDFKEQIHDIATEILVERPGVFVELMRQGFPPNLLTFWNDCNENGLTFILNQQRPTVSKILSCLKTEEVLTNEQMKVFHYLKMYIQELSSDSLLNFLYFITGSTIMPSEIKVSFNALSDHLRRPIAHTCSNVLELSYMYGTYQEFKKEMNIYQNSEFSFEYSQV